MGGGSIKSLFNWRICFAKKIQWFLLFTGPDIKQFTMNVMNMPGVQLKIVKSQQILKMFCAQQTRGQSVKSNVAILTFAQFVITSSKLLYSSAVSDNFDFFVKN